MKANYTHLGMLIDKSTSMNSIKNFVVEGFDEFLTKQKEVPGEATVTLAQFSGHGSFDYINRMSPLDQVESIATTYKPSGMTALNDAIGKFVTDIGKDLAALPEEERPSGVIIFIMTDGDENDSREYSAGNIATIVKHQEDTYNWQFIYTGANQNSAKVGQARGMLDTFDFSASKGSVNAMYMNMSEAATQYRSSIGGASTQELSSVSFKSELKKRMKTSLKNVTDQDLQSINQHLNGTATTQTLADKQDAA